MSYVLSPNGKIINKQTGKQHDAGNVTKEVLTSNKDFFESRLIKDGPFSIPTILTLPTGPLGLVNHFADTGVNEWGIIEKETPVIEEDSLFPNKTNTKGENNLLVNSSFGSSGPVSYYAQYNSHLNKSNRLLGKSFKNNVYADELEMLAGIDFNTLGIAFNLKNVDLSYFFFAIDFIIESIAYIITADYFLTRKNFAIKPMKDYFERLCPSWYGSNRFDGIKGLIFHFVLGFEEFILTDAKIPILLRDNTRPEDLEFGAFFVEHFRKILLYFSKVGRNRFFLLVRKIQKQSHWHSEILYKAKEDTAENFVDKFFVEFSHYYFKFISERMYIGYITFNSHYFKNVTSRWTDHRQDLFDTGKLERKQSLNKINLVLPEFHNKIKRYSSNQAGVAQNLAEEGYMPFYFHDLRTNEILSFNAHLNNISDSFTPNYNETKGYGRIDSVRHYIDTTRSISLGFSLVSQSESEFNHIWYQIEKLVAMVYPQWSQGIPANTGRFKSDKDFRFPFTQMPTASPMIRLKVGDVLKSNYSKQGIKGLHGNTSTFNKKISYKEDENFITSKNIDKFVMFNENWDTTELRGNFPLFDKAIDEGKKIKLPIEAWSKINSEDEFEITYVESAFNMETRLDSVLTSFAQPGNNIHTKVVIQNIYQSALRKKLDKDKKDYMIYRVFTHKGLASSQKEYSNSNLLFEETIFIAGPKETVYRPVDTSSNKHENTIKDAVTNSTTATNPLKTAEAKLNNPYTAAFESAEGLGLAGFITSLGIEGMNESTWNVNSPGANAPHSVKISIGFAPVHDIPPGLDHNGQIRAPVYNVGDVSYRYFGRRRWTNAYSDLRYTQHIKKPDEDVQALLDSAKGHTIDNTVQDRDYSKGTWQTKGGSSPYDEGQEWKTYDDEQGLSTSGFEIKR